MFALQGLSDAAAAAVQNGCRGCLPCEGWLANTCDACLRSSSSSISIYLYISTACFCLMCMCICVFRRLSNSIIIIVIIIIIAIVIVTVSRQGLRRGVTRHRFVSWRVRIAAAYHRLVTRWRRAALITAARLTANSANMANNNII